MNAVREIVVFKGGPPGAGWEAIPGGHKGGRRRKHGTGVWEYWYPEDHHTQFDNSLVVGISHHQSTDPRTPPVGTVIVKKIAGNDYVVRVNRKNDKNGHFSVTKNGEKLGGMFGFQSLSAVASAITGKSAINGFEFFGLGSKKAADGHGASVIPSSAAAKPIPPSPGNPDPSKLPQTKPASPKPTETAVPAPTIKPHGLEHLPLSPAAKSLLDKVWAKHHNTAPPSKPSTVPAEHVHAPAVSDKKDPAVAPGSKPKVVAGGTKPDIPSPDQLTKGKFLGGTTGAWLAIAADGQQFVIKETKSKVADENGSAEHIISETQADEIYDRLGVLVPRSVAYETSPGHVVKVAEFVRGKLLKDLDPASQKMAFKKVARHFVVDALLANWDSVGTGGGLDNIIVDNDGDTWRIDNGGALEWRGMQGKKGSAFGETVTETERMRDSSVNQWAAKVFKDTVSDADIASQAAKIETWVNNGALAGVKHEALLKKRLANIRKKYPLPSEVAKGGPPGGGWEVVPGSKSGGMRRHRASHGRTYEYWYPDADGKPRRWL